jgi:hypothetical protein
LLEADHEVHHLKPPLGWSCEQQQKENTQAESHTHTP